MICPAQTATSEPNCRLYEISEIHVLRNKIQLDPPPHVTARNKIVNDHRP